MGLGSERWSLEICFTSKNHLFKKHAHTPVKGGDLSSWARIGYLLRREYVLTGPMPGPLYVSTGWSENIARFEEAKEIFWSLISTSHSWFTVFAMWLVFIKYWNIEIVVLTLFYKFQKSTIKMNILQLNESMSITRHFYQTENHQKNKSILSFSSYSLC